MGRSAAFVAVGMGEEEPLNISSSLLPHNLRNTELGVLQRSKHRATAVSTSSKVAKNRFCVARRRASFQTGSTGASCGLSGGRNSRVSTARYFRSHGLRRPAWWSRALSSTSTMRVSRERCCNGVLQKGLERGRVERGAPRADDRAGAQTDGPKTGDRLAGGCIEEDRILDRGRHPHAAPGAMLLEVAFVHAPESDTPHAGPGDAVFLNAATLSGSDWAT